MTFLILAGLLLAFANGANDNFKGVATLFGSGTTRYRGALAWATATTLAGSVAAVLLAGELIARFQGKGLVPEEVVGDPGFLAAVGLGAGLTVLLATRLGLPTSTTHALVGGLVGAGLGWGEVVHIEALGRSFLAPLLASPFIALAGAAVLQPSTRLLGKRLGVARETCLCVGKETIASVPELSPVNALELREVLAVRTGMSVDCREGLRAPVVGLRAGTLLDALHYLSSGAVSFARGLNDTPKIAALLLVAPALGAGQALVATGLAIAVGGWLAARRVAHTMSLDITPMTPGQGLTANLVTSGLVLFASRFGLPVSTTHVSCGALFGLGLASGDGRARTIGTILLAWVVTLPLAGSLAWGTARFLA